LAEIAVRSEVSWGLIADQAFLTTIQSGPHDYCQQGFPFRLSFPI